MSDFEPLESQNDARERDIKKPDDDELALDLKALWKGKVAYFRNEWHVYEDGFWQTRDTHEVKRHIRSFLRDYRWRGIEVSQRQINSLLAMMEDDVFVSDKHITHAQAQAKDYINLENGMFNLKTFALEPHNPDLYLTTQLDFSYDEEADCPTFRRYLYTTLVKPNGEHDAKLSILFQQMLAYCMTARTDLKASFWLVGEPDSGKSTFIAFVRGLMGNLHGTIDLNQLGNNRFLLSGIIGKRVVTFTEASENSFLPDSIYKALVGGSDSMYADVKNKDAISFVPECKLIWGMNGMPRISDRSDAVFNRLIIIPFNRTVPKSQRIPDLLERLLSEKAGIFNLIMYAYQRLVKAGRFEQVEQVDAKRDEYQLQNDTERTFLEEMCDRNPDGKIPGKELYTAYKEWCSESGFKPKNINQVADDWRRNGLVRTKTNGGKHVWNGVQFKPMQHATPF